MIIEVGQRTEYSFAVADWSTAYGGVTAGSFLDTLDQDDAYEELTEETTSGSPSTRQSLLEHTWKLDVAPGRYQTFYVDAWHSLNSEGDDFVFEYSRDQVSWTMMLTVTKTSDDEQLQWYAFSEDARGTLYVRVRDLDRTPGNGQADTLYVDEMHVLSEPSTGHVGRVPDGISEQTGSMLQVTKSTSGNIRLTWGESCMASDTDYGVFEGPIGNFTGHLPVNCSTGGATTIAITPSEGSIYYLIVPNDDFYEGSYGEDGLGASRPPGASRCFPPAPTVGCN
jgi:hypothetical protein